MTPRLQASDHPWPSHPGGWTGHSWGKEIWVELCKKFPRKDLRLVVLCFGIWPVCFLVLLCLSLKSQISIQLFSTSPNGSWQHAQEYVPLFHVSPPYYGHVFPIHKFHQWLTGISGAGANRCTASRQLRVQMQRVKKSWRRRWSPWRLHTPIADSTGFGVNCKL